MPLDVGFIQTVAIREVWPTENADFTPWLQLNIGELDKVLGLGLSDPQREVGAGAFRIDLVAETDFGDVIIENQFGKSDHRHLGQLATYLSYRDVQRAIWIVEEARAEHVKAVEALNARGVGQIWMVTVRPVRIGDSPAAPVFTVVAEPPEDAIPPGTTGTTDPDLTPTQRQRRNFMAALFQQAQDEGIDSPFKNLKPHHAGLQDASARGPGLVYRVAVNRRGSRVVLTNKKDRWTGALAALLENRESIDDAFRRSGLPQALKWRAWLADGRWAIGYRVEAGCEGEPDRTRMLELNRASALMKSVFDPYLRALDPRLDES